MQLDFPGQAGIDTRRFADDFRTTFKSRSRGPERHASDDARRLWAVDAAGTVRRVCRDDETSR